MLVTVRLRCTFKLKVRLKLLDLERDDINCTTTSIADDKTVFRLIHLVDALHGYEGSL